MTPASSTQKLACWSITVCDNMIPQFKDKKEAIPFVVASAKIPPWLFAEIEEFRQNNELATRTATLNILILAGLSRWKEHNENECLDFIRSQGMTQVPKDLFSTPSSKEVC